MAVQVDSQTVDRQTSHSSKELLVCYTTYGKRGNDPC